MIAEIGRNLLKFFQAVIALNNQLITTLLRVCYEAWRGTGIIVTGLFHGAGQIVSYTIDLAQELLQIVYSFLAVCYALAVVLVQVLSILLAGLENIGAFIAGILLKVLRYGYESLIGILKYLGVMSMDTRMIVRSSVSAGMTVCRDGVDALLEWTSDVATLSLKQFAVFLMHLKTASIQAYKIFNENCVLAYQQISCATVCVCEYVKTNIPEVPEDLLMWCACALCLTSILLCVKKYLSRRGLTFPPFVTACPNTRVQYLRNDRDFEAFSDEEQDVEEDEDDQESTDETEETEEDSVEEYEIVTSEEEDSEDEENNENLINVQLPELTDNHHTLRSRATPFSDRSNTELSPEALEKILERERDRRACVVCQDALKCVLVLPCRHMCLCIHCAHYLVSQRIRQRICPLCRTRIETIMDVFV